MALRTFHANPSLGGFGNESSNAQLWLDRTGTTTTTTTTTTQSKNDEAIDGDAFAQIIKELVDNAVDACLSPNQEDASPKRVRVEIQPTKEDDHLLRVTVTDNGCGMDNIQACVNPFRTSKQDTESNTAGRYGIGLTLCLLHAQRLVRGSCAVIRSATAQQKEWTTLQCVVDADQDKIHCTTRIRGHQPKHFVQESGTCVSLLVRGGACATMAWPRLAEYLQRFQLSIGLGCSLEVLAPTLASVPLCIRSLRSVTNDLEQEDAKDEEWTDGFTDLGLFRTNKTAKRPKLPTTREKREGEEAKRHQWMCMAAQHYLGRTVQECNVAHSIVPIRGIAMPSGHTTKQKTSKRTATDGIPKLEMDLIVCGGVESEEDVEISNQGSFTETESTPEDSAMITLVRMVNRIPLLDSAEAEACGIAQSIASKKRIWHSFGLEVNRITPEPGTNSAKRLQFAVRDSDQVAPFFHKSNHSRLQIAEEETDVDDESLGDEPELGPNHINNSRRRRKKVPVVLLPAAQRLGNILAVIQIHAKPSTLPLPTLSKGRLPSDHVAIDNAIEVALTECLRKLQGSNPALLLTAGELRVAERDARYIPAVSEALSSILLRSTDAAEVDNLLHDKVQKWDSNGQADGKLRDHPDADKLLMRLLDTQIRTSLVSNAKLKEARTKRFTKKAKQIACVTPVEFENDISNLDRLFGYSPESQDTVTSPSKSVPEMGNEAHDDFASFGPEDDFFDF